MVFEGKIMVKITEKMGYWQNHIHKALLYYEECPNTICSIKTLHYPTYHKKASCPQCNTKLSGPKVTIGPNSRIDYHLEKV